MSSSRATSSSEADNEGVECCKGYNESGKVAKSYNSWWKELVVDERAWPRRVDARSSRGSPGACLFTVRSLSARTSPSESAALANEEHHCGAVKGDIHFTAHRAFAECTLCARMVKSLGECM